MIRWIESFKEQLRKTGLSECVFDWYKTLDYKQGRKMEKRKRSNFSFSATLAIKKYTQPATVMD